jgi:NAD-dependent DNA ligase
LRSALEDVPGVGQKRQRELLKHFGAIKNVRVATVEELLRAPGMTRAAAEAVVRYFRGDGELVPKADAAAGAAAEPRDDVAEDAAAQELAQLAPDDAGETVAATEGDADLPLDDDAGAAFDSVDDEEE